MAAFLSSSQSREESQQNFEAQALEADVLDLLTPLIGDISTALEGFINIGKIGMGVAKFINIISDQIFNMSAEAMNFGSYVPMADRKILAMFELLSRRLDQIEHGVQGVANSLRDLADGLQEMVRWEIALNTMEEYARPINTLYKRFLLYQSLKDRVSLLLCVPLVRKITETLRGKHDEVGVSNL